jgi:hypothetical protein
MTRAAPHSTAHYAKVTRAIFSSPGLGGLPPLVLPRPQVVAPEPQPTKRTRIWEFNSNLHCSIIGTCLTTGELRQVLGKTGVAPAGATDHELHGIAVSLASKHDQAAKLLHKALDHRHRIVINQFSRLSTEDGVRTAWREAVGRGDIPGAYWATLTHPAATRAVIRDAFGEVHMLSHMVGAANRADIRRLRELEVEQGELLGKLSAQQDAFRDAVVSRDRRIRELKQALTQSLQACQAAPASDDTVSAMRALIVDLERRLDADGRRRESLEDQVVRLRPIAEREKAEQAMAELQHELGVIEESWSDTPDAPQAGLPDCAGMTVLYVGGRPNQVSHLRGMGQRLGAAFLHHDGGKEQHTDLLPGLISRADLVLFPVDCISHEAALAIKRLCRQAAKGFVPLRSAGAASLLAALAKMQSARLNPAAAE